MPIDINNTRIVSRGRMGPVEIGLHEEYNDREYRARHLIFITNVSNSVINLQELPTLTTTGRNMDFIMHPGGTFRLNADDANEDLRGFLGMAPRPVYQVRNYSQNTDFARGVIDYARAAQIEENMRMRESIERLARMPHYGTRPQPIPAGQIHDSYWYDESPAAGVNLDDFIVDPSGKLHAKLKETSDRAGTKRSGFGKFSKKVG